MRIVSMNDSLEARNWEGILEHSFTNILVPFLVLLFYLGDFSDPFISLHLCSHCPGQVIIMSCLDSDCSTESSLSQSCRLAHHCYQYGYYDQVHWSDNMIIVFKPLWWLPSALQIRCQTFKEWHTRPFIYNIYLHPFYLLKVCASAILLPFDSWSLCMML